MNLKTANISILGVFFLYLIILGSNIHLLLNCGLQKLLKDNFYLLHIVIFISIFLFTFILKWYTISPLSFTENYKNINSKETKREVKIEKYKYLYESLKNTFIIYILFILSTKQEHIFMYSSLILSMFIIFFLILYTIEYDILGIKDDKFNEFNFITEDSINIKKNIDNIDNITNFIYFNNILIILYILIIINIITGVLFYYRRQSIEYKNSWNWLKFIFGTNKCNKL